MLHTKHREEQQHVNKAGWRQDRRQLSLLVCSVDVSNIVPVVRSKEFVVQNSAQPGGERQSSVAAIDNERNVEICRKCRSAAAATLAATASRSISFPRSTAATAIWSTKPEQFQVSISNFLI